MRVRISEPDALCVCAIARACCICKAFNEPWCLVVVFLFFSFFYYSFLFLWWVFICSILFDCWFGLFLLWLYIYTYIYYLYVCVCMFHASCVFNVLFPSSPHSRHLQVVQQQVVVCFDAINSVVTSHGHHNGRYFSLSLFFRHTLSHSRPHSCFQA